MWNSLEELNQPLISLWNPGNSPLAVASLKRPATAWPGSLFSGLLAALVLALAGPAARAQTATDTGASSQSTQLPSIKLETGSSSSSPSTTQNGNTDHAFQMWTPIFIDVPLSRSRKARGYFEASPRLGDNLKGMNQLLLRSGLGYRFTPHFSGYVGHVWVGNFQPQFLTENRIFQQLGFGHSLGKRLQVLHRARLEERFIQDTGGDCSMRARYLLRLALPLKKKFYAVVSDELFVNLNTVGNGPVSGIDQNRIYAGIGRQMNNSLRLEVGYQQQYVNKTDPTDDKANHILVTSVFVSL